MLRLVMIIFGLYSMALGTATLLIPQQLTNFLGHPITASCHPWVQLIGPMAIALGLGVLAGIGEPRRHVAVLQAAVAWAVFQIPLDVYFLVGGTFSFGQIGLDLVILSGTAIAIVALYPDRGDLFRLQPWARGGTGALRLQPVRVCLGVLIGYLFVGWTLATFLPQYMNDLLRQSVSSSCLPWVQYSGSPAPALAVAYLGVMADPIRNRRIVLFSGIGGCVLEIWLDVAIIWLGAATWWQVAVDLLVVTYGLIALSIAYPHLAKAEGALSASLAGPRLEDAGR